MGLDPQVETVLKGFEAMGAKPFHEMTVDEAREAIQGFAALMGPMEDVADVEALTVAGPAGEIPVRLYRPEATGSLPVLVWFHGGGWTTGNVALYESICRALANRSRCLVASVEYRLAPEHPYPAGPEDCYAVTAWIAQYAADLGGDPSRVAVGGDSAGGNLAAVVTLMARDRGVPDLAYQVLIYPVTNYAFDTASYVDNGDGYVLTTAFMRWFWTHYLSGDGDGSDPYASPLRAPDLSGLPPAFVVTAEFDPLRDEGEAYAARLTEAGGAVDARRYDGMIHAFMCMAGLVERGGKLIDDIGAALRSAL